MVNIKLLDCTLRDGGYVNNFDFKDKNISLISDNLALSGVDLIELGFLKDGTHSTDQTLFNSPEEAEKYATQTDSEYCLMIRPDWYDINQLTESKRIKHIRFAFHKRDIKLMLHQASIARSKGYKVYFNPVNVMSYEEEELKEILIELNKFSPEAIYIVDTFGAILPNDLDRLYEIFDQHIDEGIAIGLHLHENLSIALALACLFIEKLKEGTRKAYIDSSILGMGRIPGNLCTELIVNYLNREKEVYSTEPIYEMIQEVISPIKKINNWGYMPAYALTGFYKVHRSYAEHLLNKPSITLNLLDIILLEIKYSDKALTFDKEYADLLYGKHS
jgi:4-hydroxy 2-oxovalerate aldolase